MNRHVHLVIPDLLLPTEIAARAGAGLQLPALEKILACATSAALAQNSLESWLCQAFGVAGQAVAPVTLQADGMAPGTHYWLRADPVHLELAHDQLLLLPALPVSGQEAAQMCAALNEHFAAESLHFVAPHPQRWYLRLECDPQLVTFPLARVAGRNMRHFLPQGEQRLHWHRILNEIQMLLFAHPLNQLRAQRGAMEIGGLWLWGGGHGGAPLQQPASRLYTDSPLAAAFATVAGIDAAPLPADAGECIAQCAADKVLVVWDGLRGALQHEDFVAWRSSLQRLERDCLSPLWRALVEGRIDRITLDALQESGAQRYMLRRGDRWKFWRRRRPLEHYALV
jgi:hypothetical protein